MFNKTIPQVGAGLKSVNPSPPRPAPPRDAGRKSHPIPASPPLRGGENPHGAKRGGAGQAGRGKIAIPTATSTYTYGVTIVTRVCSDLHNFYNLM